MKLLKKSVRIIEKIKCKKNSIINALRVRYLKLALADCGKNLKLYGKPTIYEPHKVHIGKNVTMNEGVQICPRSEIFIGNYVTMSRGSMIISGSLDMSQWIDEKYKEHIHTEKPIFIGEGTWLCAGSIILPGVKITGKGVVIAAGAVVNKDIDEDYCLVAGVPAKVVKKFV